MKARTRGLVTAAALATGLGTFGTALIGAAMLTAGVSARADQQTTEDILIMADGRVLHGQIIEEKADSILFEVSINGIKSRIAYSKTDIEKVERDIAVAAVEGAAESAKPAGASSSAKKDDKGAKEEERTFGARRGDDASLTSFYFIPMKGQPGTDIHVDIYKEMVKDIREKDPDYLVIEVECLDDEERLYNRIEREEGGFAGSEFLDMYRDLINLFHDELRDIKQVVMVRDSKGISSILAMSWDDIYMLPEARLGGLRKASVNFEAVRADADKYGKFREAYMAWLRGFVENSHHDLSLVDAMVRNEMTLSASWQGRKVKWSLDKSGEYVLDPSEDETVNFTAKTAEDFAVSRGTVEDMNDIALLMGLREYRIVEDAKGPEMFEQYRKDWRAAYEKAKEHFQEFVDLPQRPGLTQAEVLGKQKALLEKVLASVERYKAVEIRLQADFGINKLSIIADIERMKEALRALRSQGRQGGGRGAPGSGGPGLGGGG